jgi:hypothetical protein
LFSYKLPLKRDSLNSALVNYSRSHSFFGGDIDDLNRSAKGTLVNRGRAAADLKIALSHHQGDLLISFYHDWLIEKSRRNGVAGHNGLTRPLAGYERAISDEVLKTPAHGNPRVRDIFRGDNIACYHA